MTFAGDVQAGDTASGRRVTRWIRLGLAAMFLLGGLIHLLLVTTMPEVYKNFAVTSPFAAVRDAWRMWFVPHTVLWGSAQAVFELVLAILLVMGGRWSRLALAGAIGFHLALIAFGWAYLLWSGPMIALMVWLYVAVSPTPVRTSATKRGSLHQ